MSHYEKDSSGRRIYPQHIKHDVLSLIAAGASAAVVAAKYELAPSLIRKWRAAPRRHATRVSDAALAADALAANSGPSVTSLAAEN